MEHIFISYSRQTQTYAQSLAEAIRQHGFDVWIDNRIEYGDRWFQTIVTAIKSSAAFIVIMSPAAEQSEWVEREILLAQREQIPIFPLLLDGKEFPLLITSQFLDVRGRVLPPESFYAQLAAVVPQQRRPGSFVAIDMIRQPNIPSQNVIESRRPVQNKRSFRNICLWIVGIVMVLMLILIVVIFALALYGPGPQ